MRRAKVTVCSWLLLALFSGPVLATESAQELLAAAKATSGGSAWDGVTSLHLQGSIATSGLEGTIESWEDLVRGRLVIRADLGILNVANGFDGTTPWNQDPSGDVTEQGSENDLRSAHNEAFLSARAFWFPDRWAAEIASGGIRKFDGHTYHVLEVVPEGGGQLEIWLDAETHLVARIVEEDANPVETTYLSDYRAVGDLLLPHRIRTSTGDSQYDVMIDVASIEINPQLSEGHFDIPSVTVDDFVIADGATSTTLPFELLNNHIYVEATVNGNHGGRFLVDTGGVNLLTQSAAARFGVESEGSIQGRGVGEETVDVAIASLESFTIGAVTLDGPTFFVIPLGPVLAAEGVDFDGLIGFEVFKRFVVEIDYSRRLLTLSRPDAFEYAGEGVPIPFKFDDRTPVVDGAIASVPATFSIDTGSRSTVDLYAPFVAAQNFETILEPRLEGITGWGVGGGVRSKVAPGATLQLGDVEVTDVIVSFSQQEEGAFADRYTAGNIGAGVLKRFTVTFDYGEKIMILEPNDLFDKPDPFDKSGMWINFDGDAFKVVDVITGGAADDAGIRVGDRIVACNGKAPTELGLPAMREDFRRQPPGTVFELAVDTQSGNRVVQLELKDLLAQ
jgi:hypothetical protein